MNDESSQSGWMKLFDFLNRIRGGILTFFAFFTAILGGIQLLRGETGLFWIFSLFISIGILWLSSFYVYFKRTEPAKSAGFVSQESERKYLFSRRIRYLALIGIISLPALTITGLIGWKYINNLPSDKITILVANFEGPDQTYGVTEKIIEQLREEVKQFPDIQIQALGRPITAQEGSDAARIVGKEHKANIVLWGWYRKTQENVFITIHFEALQGPRYLPLRSNKQELNLAVAELESFQIQTRLSGEFTYLTLLTIGIARLEAKDYDGSINLFTKALGQNAVPEQMIEPAFIYYYRGTAYSAKVDYDHAITDYTEAIRTKPNFASAYNSRGIAHSWKGEYELAITDFNITINLEPDKAGAYVSRGSAYGYIGQNERAIADFDKAIKLKPDNKIAYNQRGNFYLAEGDIDRAIIDYTNIIRLDHNFTGGYLGRGNAYSRKRDYDNAIADYSQLIHLIPNSATGYSSRGNAYVSKRDYDNAIVDFNEAIRLEPNFGGSYLGRGNAYFFKSDYDKAIADYSEEIRLIPNSVAGYLSRGQAYKSRGNKDQAIADFQKALQLSTDSGQIDFLKQQLREFGIDQGIR
jgi:tetratricopeptide (TPR) repeat protein